MWNLTRWAKQCLCGGGSRGMGPRGHLDFHNLSDHGLGEVVGPHLTQSPSFVVLSPPLDAFDSHLNRVTLLLEQLRHNRHDDRNVVISMMFKAINGKCMISWPPWLGVKEEFWRSWNT